MSPVAVAPVAVAPVAGEPGGPPLPAKSTRGADAEGVFTPGTLIGGKYTIVSLLGEGGMGCVYMAEQQLGATRRKVAVKTLHMHLSRDEKVRARFEREVSTIASLEHPNTIQVFDFGTTEDGVLYIVMELAVGRNLGDAIAQEGAFETTRSIKILLQIAGSLQEAHARGIVHRDLKPDNIMLCDRAGQRDFVKVLDFGIAKTQASDVDARKLTMQGTVLGTPPYMSPEQFVGDSLDGRSDVYSLGIIAYELATGTLPFEADTAYEWATRHMTEAPTPFEAHPKGRLAPTAYREAVYRALRKDRKERFATPQEFADALTAVDARGYQTVKHAGPATGAIAGTIGPGSTMRGDDVPPVTGAQHRPSNPGCVAGGPASNYGGNAYGPGAFGAPGVHPLSPPYGNAAYGGPGFAGYGPPGTPAYGSPTAGAAPMPYGNAGSLHATQPKSRTGLYVALAIVSALSLCAIGAVLLVKSADPVPVAVPATAHTPTTPPSTATAGATASTDLGVALAPVTSRTDPNRPQVGPGALGPGGGPLRPNGAAAAPATGTAAQPGTQLITPNLAWTAIPIIPIPQIPGMPGQAQPPQTQPPQTQPPQTQPGAGTPAVIRPSAQQQEQAAVCSRARAARLRMSANADDLDRRCRELGGTP
jgi:eukaryotic-like serine/threonine-protein kinase